MQFRLKNIFKALSLPVNWLGGRMLCYGLQHRICWLKSNPSLHLMSPHPAAFYKDGTAVNNGR